MSFEVSMGDAKGYGDMEVRVPRTFSFPDGTAATTVPILIRVGDGRESSARIAEVSQRDGRLVALQDLELAERGSAQYAARTREWVGSPDGPVDPFRCIAGIILPLYLQAQLEPDSKAHPLGAFAHAVWRNATWEVIDDASGPLGNVTFAGREGPWPLEASWRPNTGIACKVQALSVTAGNPVIAWGVGASRGSPSVHAVPLRGPSPPTGRFPVAISLEDAEAAARREIAVGAFLRGHPEAWVTMAEYNGPPGKAALAEKAWWSIIYGDPASGKTLWVKVERIPSGTLVASVVTEGEEAFVLNRSALEQGLVSADAVVSSVIAGALNADRLRLQWFTARSPSEVGTADAALWQVGWPVDKGWTSFLYSAVNGEAVAHVVSPEIHIGGGALSLDLTGPSTGSGE